MSTTLQLSQQRHLLRRLLHLTHRASPKFNSSAAAATQSVPTNNSVPVGAGESEFPTSRPVLDHHDYFDVRNLVSIRELFNARVHLGHKEGSLNEKMTHHLFGKRFGSCIIDLDQTQPLMGDALNFVAHIVYRGGILLFVCRNRFHVHTVERSAREMGEYSLCRYWHYGTFCNSEQLFGALTRLPDAVIFLSAHSSVVLPHVGIGESALMNIPTVAIVDSNCNPDEITYVVPGNDDSIQSIELYLRLFGQAVSRGKSKRQEHLDAYGGLLV